LECLKDKFSYFWGISKVFKKRGIIARELFEIIEIKVP
jgi:hypothetical protein